MKRETALKNLKKIIDKVKAVNGILSTPKHRNDYIKIKRMWLFGSVAKGKQNPNDIDVFIEVLNDSKRYKLENTDRFLDKEYYRKYGIRRLKASEFYLKKWLRSGMKNVSIHVLGEDEVFDGLDVKYLIYPRNDFFNKHLSLLESR